MSMNRRSMLQNLAALAAGLVAAPKAAAVPRSAPDDYGPRLPPDEQAAHDREHGLMLAALQEAIDALKAARSLHERCRCEGCHCDLYDDAVGMLYSFEFYESSVWGQSYPGAKDVAETQQARQQPHPGPERRVLLALAAVKAAAEEVLDRHACPDGEDLHFDAEGVVWQMGLYETHWTCSADEHVIDVESD